MLKSHYTLGLGTFNPVEVEDLSKHKMDSEEIIIPTQTATTINTALKKNVVFVQLEQPLCVLLKALYLLKEI